MDKCPLTGRPCNKQRPFHITEIQDNKPVQFDLCEDCLSAYVGHGNDMKTSPPASEMEKMVNELFQFMLGGIKPKVQLQEKPSCPHCNSSYADIVKAGKVGCPNCWEHFEQELDAVIRRVQSENIQHTGKVPKKWKEKQLKEQKSQIPVAFKMEIIKSNMQKFIEAEKYEEAAKLRDVLKALTKLNNHYEALKLRLEEAIVNEEPIEVLQKKMQEVLDKINELDGL